MGYLYNAGQMNAAKMAEIDPPSKAVSPTYREDYRNLVSRPLQRSDLEGKTKAELSLIRNTIYAIHGYIFRKNPNIIDYFKKVNWYQPNPGFNEKRDFSQMDKDNVDLLVQMESQAVN